MMQSSRRTRQPLSEIVLEAKKSVKRPLSPSSLLLSPSKRRVLAAEGFSASPQRVPKRTSAEALAPSFASVKTTSGQVATPPMDTSCTSSNSFPSETSFPKYNLAEGEHTSTSPAHPLLIPRETPSIANRQSVHWPGFDVHCDAYISIPTSASESPDQAPSDGESDSEKSKENVKPRRIIAKRLDTTDVNPFEDDRPSPKKFALTSIFSTIESNAEEEVAVDQLL